MYLQRTSEQMIKEVSESFPCIAVYGPRQVGKSTTINQLFGADYRSVTLDDLDDRTLAAANPKLFLESYGFPLIIDEIQKAPQLIDEIKKIIDKQRLVWIKENRKPELMYILTGSNRFELQQEISDSLAGRCGVIEMSSFSQAEKDGREETLFSPILENLRKQESILPKYYRTRKHVFEDIYTGGMPDICVGNSSRDVYFKSYISTYIEKDVRKLRKGDLLIV